MLSFSAFCAELLPNNFLNINKYNFRFLGVLGFWGREVIAQADEIDLDEDAA